MTELKQPLKTINLEVKEGCQTSNYIYKANSPYDIEATIKNYFNNSSEITSLLNISAEELQGIMAASKKVTLTDLVTINTLKERHGEYLSNSEHGKYINGEKHGVWTENNDHVNNITGEYAEYYLGNEVARAETLYELRQKIASDKTDNFIERPLLGVNFE